MEDSQCFCIKESILFDSNIIPRKMLFFALGSILNLSSLGGTRGVMVIVVGNGHSIMSSNPRPG